MTKETLVDLFKESTITQAVLALMVIAVACYCTAQQIPLPDYFLILAGTVIGHYFRAKQDVQVSKVRRHAEELTPAPAPTPPAPTV